MTGISQDVEVCPYSGWCKYLTVQTVLNDLTVPESCLAIACYAMDISSQNQHLLQLHELELVRVQQGWHTGDHVICTVMFPSEQSMALVLTKVPNVCDQQSLLYAQRVGRDLTL